MKISKKLLESIAVGLIVVATATSCEKNEFFNKTKEACEDATSVFSEKLLPNQTQHTGDDCPGCGMG